MFLQRNTSGQVFVLPGSLRAVADGSAVTSSASITIVKDGTSGAGAGTLTHISGGAYKYAPTQAETDCKILGYVLEAAEAITLAGSIRTTGADPDDATALGLARLDATVSSRFPTASYTPPSNPSDYARNNVSPSWYTAPSNPVDYARNDVAPSWYSAAPSAGSVASAVWDAALGDHDGAGSFGAFVASIPGATWDVLTADHATIGTFGLETVTMMPPNPWETTGYVKASPTPTAHQFLVCNVSGVLGSSRLSLGIDAPEIGGRPYRVASVVDMGPSSPGPGRDYLVQMLDDLPIAPAADSLAYFETRSAPHAADLIGYKLASDGLDSISTAAPTGRAGNFREMQIQTWMRWYNKSMKDVGTQTIATYAADGATVVTTQAYTQDESGNQSIGGAA